MSDRTVGPSAGTEGDDAVFVISVAAELSGMHPQTLRQYDRLGLVSPGRSSGRGRRYSLRDIAVLREVQRLSQEEGVNLAGIKRILELENEVDHLRRQLSDLADRLGSVRGSPSYRSGDSDSDTRYLPVPAPRQAPTALVIWRSSRR